MGFRLLEIWKWDVTIGIMLFSIDLNREDEMVFALLGFSWDKEERELQIDIFWKCFTFRF